MRKLILCVAILVTVCTFAVEGQSPSANRRPPSGAPTVIPAEHFDVSPPLRDILPVVDPSEHLREHPRHPHHPKHGTHHSNIATDPVVQDNFGGSPAPGTLHSIEGINNIDQE